jgi:hypothetical protein
MSTLRSELIKDAKKLDLSSITNYKATKIETPTQPSLKKRKMAILRVDHSPAPSLEILGDQLKEAVSKGDTPLMEIIQEQLLSIAWSRK